VDRDLRGDRSREPMTTSPYPRIRVAGTPIERGRGYGSQARDRVQRSLAAYEVAFAHYQGWDWRRVTEEAKRFEEPIAEYDGRYLEEIAGIAEGAGADYADILALNVRTEVIFSARAAAASHLPAECTSFALLPSASREGETLIGQTWDWMLHAFETVVTLDVEQPEAPSFVTVVEAGLLAKTGMNSAGVGLVTNALVTAADVGEPSVPYHIVLRAILDSETIVDALRTIQRQPRASSANYMIAHSDGLAIDVEAAPGDFSKLYLLHPANGILLHTNHFLSPAFDGRDLSVWAMPDTPFRLARLDALVREQGARDLQALQCVLADHAGKPFSICCHPDARANPIEQSATVVAVTMNLDRHEIWVTAGSPCTSAFHRLDLEVLRLGA
jgi:isopenicillin-N N-acyltransferase-like protein